MKSIICSHCVQQLAAPDALNDRIRGFAALVGLVLVLVTLFTSQRNSHIQELRGGTPQKRDWTTEIWLNSVLAVFTVGLFLAGLPLFIDSAEDLHPLRNAGPLRGAFVLVWLLLIALIVWQCSLAVAALCGRRKWEADRGSR